MAGIIAAKIASIPCICYERSTKKEILRRERIFSKWVDHFVVLNSATADFYRQFVPAHKISLVPDKREYYQFCCFGCWVFLRTQV